MNPLYKNTDGVELILASASPRRRELLESLGLSFQVIPSEIDESAVGGEPEELVRMLAYLKAEEIAKKHPDHWVLGGDTIVVIDGEVLGKPRDEEESWEMISKLSGKSHEVLGGVSLVHRSSSFSETFALSTTVKFKELSREAIDKYVGTGEGLDKAGAYAIQGVGQVLVSEIEGSYTNVIGLDVPRVADLLLDAGVIQWR